METIKNNINNLTHLWTTVSKPFNGYANDDIISYSRIQNSEWPNKIWTSQKLTLEILHNVKTLVSTSQTKLRFIDFEYDKKINKKLIESSGFVLTSSLPGMHLKLNTLFKTKTKLNFLLVTNANDAKTWCDIFKTSFGYIISKDVVLKSMHRVSYYVAFENNKPIGVIKLHLTNKIAGIYSLGVPSNLRGNGYAKEMMHFILNKSFE
ncbi:GNAT family N-acetyltransferase [Lacinutrix iliipiscaria]|uniref:GNAT family N-acetyltransferase n=1 Tax=Lacinutrix iliipiscaria TaxID=1230532 RepID=A0ABW5WPI7_9FLAO